MNHLLILIMKVYLVLCLGLLVPVAECDASDGRRSKGTQVGRPRTKRRAGGTRLILYFEQEFILSMMDEIPGVNFTRTMNVLKGVGKYADGLACRTGQEPFNSTEAELVRKHFRAKMAKAELYYEELFSRDVHLNITKIGNKKFGPNCKSGNCSLDMVKMTFVCGQIPPQSFEDGKSCIDNSDPFNEADYQQLIVDPDVKKSSSEESVSDETIKARHENERANASYGKNCRSRLCHYAPKRGAYICGTPSSSSRVQSTSRLVHFLSILPFIRSTRLLQSILLLGFVVSVLGDSNGTGSSSAPEVWMDFRQIGMPIPGIDPARYVPLNRSETEKWADGKSCITGQEPFNEAEAEIQKKYFIDAGKARKERYEVIYSLDFHRNLWKYFNKKYEQQCQSQICSVDFLRMSVICGPLPRRGFPNEASCLDGSKPLSRSDYKRMVKELKLEDVDKDYSGSVTYLENMKAQGNYGKYCMSGKCNYDFKRGNYICNSHSLRPFPVLTIILISSHLFRMLFSQCNFVE